VPFAAGQYARICFNAQDPNDRELNKFLSFSYAPGSGYVEFTKRISQSAFSRALMALKTGDPVGLGEAKGHCVLAPMYRKVLYLVGGIGITPAISMLDDVYPRGKSLDAVLLYANRSPEDAAFKETFDAWNGKRGFSVVYTYTDCDVKGHCEFGFINEEMLRRRVPDWKDRTVFVFGPPAMVKATRELCAAMGIEKEHVLFETFAGY
jgi:ferredoxin-NADP reductase